MRKLFYLILFITFYVCHASAQNTQSVALNFCRENFKFSYDKNGSLVIGSRNYVCGYGSDTSEPGLPLVSINIRIQNGCSYEGVSYTGEQNKIFENVVVTANPTGIPTNVTTTTHVNQVAYSKSIYPSNNIQFVEESRFDGYTILRFLVCPFVYNAKEKSLYLIDNMSLNINLKAATAVYDLETGGENMAELVNSTIVNSETFNTVAQPQISVIDTASSLKKEHNYIIVTSSKLADSFKPLATWKTMKGVKAKIATIDEIVKKYPAKDTQLSIKYYLYDMYKNDGLKYVLLGGDDSVVPVRGCYGIAGERGKPNFREDFHIPTDLYYSCFGGDFSWDANNNGIYGELADNISMNPSIFVTRAPVRSTEDVNAFVNKITGYERNPNKNGWTNNILMAGDMLSGYDDTDGQSDSKIKGDELFDEYIYKNWNGKRTRLYDTYSDTDGAFLNIQTFQKELQRGYTFVDMISHGEPNLWQFGKEYYSLNESNAVENPRYTIITTMSCSTNAFDSFSGDRGRYYDDPCLSESFIRNQKSGVIAYLGCSREGWYIPQPYYDLTYSLQYEALFYENLLNGNVQDKNFGKVVAIAKQQMAPLCSQYGENRWIQYGLNPVGDPEMPVYIYSPSSFDGKCKWRFDKNGTYLDTGVDGCTACIMSTNDNGQSIYIVKSEIRKVYVPNKTVSVCITKQGYIPWCDKYVFTPNNSSIASCSINRADGNVTIATDIANDAKESVLVLSSVSGEKLSTTNVPTGTHTTAIEKSKIKEGVNIISLYVNGKLADSKNIIK